MSRKRSVKIEERYLSENEFTRYITTAGVVILPYVRALGASGIMSLALSHRIPVIAAGSGPLFEEVSDIVSVVPPMNADALADEIIKSLVLRNTARLFLAILKNTYQSMIGP